MNEGSPTKHAFATQSVMLVNGDTPLKVPGGYAIPKIADWDGDGRFDILSGSGAGGVFWFRNVGTKGAPKFAPAQAIVQPNESKGDSANPTGPGERTQVCATDYDGDGDLDLLVGDNSEGDERHGWVWLFRRK
jgi:hypothetical protein